MIAVRQVDPIRPVASVRFQVLGPRSLEPIVRPSLHPAAGLPPEGRSIVALMTQMTDQRPRDLSNTTPTFHEFSAQNRISGVDLQGRKLLFIDANPRGPEGPRRELPRVKVTLPHVDIHSIRAHVLPWPEVNVNPLPDLLGAYAAEVRVRPAQGRRPPSTLSFD
jgi:hypothetical protein